MYLLPDAREYRWLPTLMAAAHDIKNAQSMPRLGLDSRLAMRHGGGIPHDNDDDKDETADATATTTQQQQQQGPGCYFCNRHSRSGKFDERTVRWGPAM